MMELFHTSYNSKENKAVVRFTYRHSRYLAIFHDDELDVFTAGDENDQMIDGHIPIADLIAFAKAGGKVEGEPWVDYPATYKKAQRAFGLDTHDLNVMREIEAIIAERDALKVTNNVHRADVVASHRTIDTLKAEVAKLSKVKEPMIKQCNIRCVDCENLDLSKVKGGEGPCKPGTHAAAELTTDIYLRVGCDRYTPAIAGCGSADQALRAELARVTEDK